MPALHLGHRLGYYFPGFQDSADCGRVIVVTAWRAGLVYALACVSLTFDLG